MSSFPARSSRQRGLLPWNLAQFPVLDGLCPPPLPAHSGPATLVDMCVETVVQHIDKLDETYLEPLPIRVVSRIWEAVKQKRRLSVETWKLMAKTLTRSILNDPGTRHHICPLLMSHSISTPMARPLAEYIEPLGSETFCFLTHLIIAGNIRSPPPDLSQLVELKNLAVLEIIDHGGGKLFPRLTDSVLQQWSTRPGAFPVLRILRVWGEGQTTKQSLRYIHTFPSLVMYDIARRRRDWEGIGRDTRTTTHQTSEEAAGSSWTATRQVCRTVCQVEAGSTWNMKHSNWYVPLEATLISHLDLVETSISHDLPKMESPANNDLHYLRFGSPARQPQKIALTSHQRYSTHFQEVFKHLKDPLALRQVFFGLSGRRVYTSRAYTSAAFKHLNTRNPYIGIWNKPGYYLSGDGFRNFIRHDPSHRISNFSNGHEFWGFFLYSFIGTLLHNRDLSAQGLEIGERAFSLGGIVLPPRPMINVHLGWESQTGLPLKPFKTVPEKSKIYLTFVRIKRESETSSSTAKTDETKKRPADTSNESDKRHRKRPDNSDSYSPSQLNQG
ncbi:hypothetical protein F5Y03DRAFT_399544 [Xylaria venustula]|nr:hypothetical protein F5Y03DRAFT_399544 [Xylaria venustula]